MKRKTGIGSNNFWKIQCLDCGINCDLLTDNWKRIICRECLEKHEFKEVEHEGLSESGSEMGEIWGAARSEEVFLRSSNIAHELIDNFRLPKHDENNGAK